jgi:magnesium-transporting ATPase (P-type)
MPAFTPLNWLLLAAGDAVGADARLLEAALEVSEAPLTGESLPVSKIRTSRR